MSHTLHAIIKSPPKIENCAATAKAVIFVGKRKVLLLRKHSGKWDLPGGKLEPGENWLDGLSREVMEESGLCIREANWVAGWLEEDMDSARIVRGVFHCEVKRGSKIDRIEVSEEHIDWKFADLRHVDDFYMREEYIEAINMAAARAKI